MLELIWAPGGSPTHVYHEGRFYMEPSLKISTHFELEEFMNDDGDWVPEGLSEVQALERLRVLAHSLEDIRYKLGEAPIRITSGHRTKADQRRINPSSMRSMHLENLGVDIHVEGFSPTDVFIMLTGDWPGGLGLYTTHVHVDRRDYLGRGEARWKKL